MLQPYVSSVIMYFASFTHFT